MLTARKSFASGISLNFEEQDKLTSKELSEYLYRFRLVYGTSVHVTGKNIGDMETLLANSHHLEVRVRHELASRSTEEQYRDFYLDDLGDEELVVEKLSKESPFMIIFAGVFAAVALAAILSGGKGKAKASAEGFEFEFDLPPIAEGLRKLRDVFHQKTKSDKDEERPAEAAAPAAAAAGSSKEDDEEEKERDAEV